MLAARKKQGGMKSMKRLILHYLSSCVALTMLCAIPAYAERSQPAPAKSLPTMPSATKPAPVNVPSSQFTIAQLINSDYGLNGTWKLQFSVGGILHESILIMEGDSGAMRTRYYNSATGRAESVDQAMKLQSSSQGLVLLGFNPVYAGTTTRHRTYSPDNFLFQIRPNGALVSFTCDRGGRCSPVDMERIR
jgi:hypothetical protein